MSTPSTLGFRDDLRYEWIPDPAGGAGLTPFAVSRQDLPTSTGEPLLVPMKGQYRTVWHIDVRWRCYLHYTVDSLIAEEEPRLAPTVYGNRDESTPHGIAYTKLHEAIRDHAYREKCSYVAMADIASFHEQVTWERIAALSWVSPELQDSLAELRRQSGSPLCHANRWGARIRNLLLMPLDNRVRGDFYRWSDGYYLLSRSRQSALQGLDHLRNAALAIGFPLNEAKTKVMTFKNYLDGPGDLTSARISSNVNGYNQAIAERDERKLRYILARHSARVDSSRLPRLADLAASHPQLLPRIVGYLARSPAEDETCEELTSKIPPDNAAWHYARILPLLLAKPHIPVPDRVPLDALSLPSPSIQTLAYLERSGKGYQVDRPQVPLLNRIVGLHPEKYAPILDSAL